MDIHSFPCSQKHPIIVHEVGMCGGWMEAVLCRQQTAGSGLGRAAPETADSERSGGETSS